MIFDHRVAVITGAAGRIGRALAEELGKYGVRLALTDIHQEKVEELADTLTEKGICAAGFLMDVTGTDSVKQAADAIYKKFGKVDILVNNAGAWPQGTFLDMDEALWTRVIDLNLHSVFRVTKAFIRGMTEQKYGRIINLGSIAGEAGLPGFSAYSSSKAAVIMLTKNLAMELAKKGITVNCVSPGMISDEQKPNDGTWLGRSGTGDEIARPIAFLASDDSGYITGHDFTVDGGRILGPHNSRFE